VSKTIPVEKSVGMVLPHDVTEIRQGEFKGRAFKKGHIIRPEDIEHLKRLGKENIYILELGNNDIHENEAAEILVSALCGPGTKPSGAPTEGKINILADTDGLLKVHIKDLADFNMLGDVMCATLHANTVVSAGEIVAATRLIPLVGKRAIVNQAAEIARKDGGIVRVLPLRKARAALLITGNEVFNGRIKDAFEPILRAKLTELGSSVESVRFAPDNAVYIASSIQKAIDSGADLIITSGGMSVDPDDVTRQGISKAGATDIVYGTPVLPGAMFLTAYIGNVPVLGVPACGMFHRITVLDLLLPRILSGERIGRTEIAVMGHGGLCRNCKTCHHPICGFGK
jgi:molybdenum cofactor synthesis domain-containing protein